MLNNCNTTTITTNTATDTTADKTAVKLHTLSGVRVGELYSTLLPERRRANALHETDVIQAQLLISRKHNYNKARR